VASPDFSILKARIDALERQIEGLEHTVGTLLIFLAAHEIIGPEDFDLPMLEVHHKNRNPLDNALENLQLRRTAPRQGR